MTSQPRPDDPHWAGVAAAGLGVYVHVPFCSHRCGYCDFAAFDGLDNLMVDYVDVVVREIGDRVHEPAATVFVGGGTPSRLPPELLHRLLATVPKLPDAECTVEMNPESATPAVLEAARDAGANRVSMGMQSAVPHVLAFLERRHEPATAAAAVAAARRAGYGAVSLDVIYGTPGESAADWDRTLDAVLALEPDHVSAYALTVEPPTPLGRAIAAGTKPPPDDDVCADRLAQTVERLGAAGFVRYEISNWARSGTAPCIHNLRYWSGGAYVGVGCGAHSYDPPARVRSWNHRHPRSYLQQRHEGGETLDAATVAEETLFLGLRRACGVPWDGPLPADLVNAGLLAGTAGGRIRLTDSGMGVANSVILGLSDLSLVAPEC